MTDAVPLLATARTAVAEAMHVARLIQGRIQDMPGLVKSDLSPVTVADFAVQALICLRLRAVLGQFLLVGEESTGLLRSEAGAAVREAVTTAVRIVWSEITPGEVLAAIDSGAHDATAPAYWTLDPIDGTKGFLRGGQYAISLAFIERGQVTLGIMGCPNLSLDFDRSFADPDPAGLLYYASRGGGAWVSRPDGGASGGMAVRYGTSEGSIRVCESVESGHSKQDATARVIAALGGAATPTRLDSQCKYAVVARGQADAYLRLPTRADYVENIWDHAAGMLVAAEAGAEITDIDGQPLDFSCGKGLSRNRGIICASPRFHARIVEAIRAVNL
ncbi:MAG: 3'(2'),5'-bisphosphate nucleotidase [Beggiatoa sp.]|nr:3'(2'),5'-bisphosphate nucleotidase [Beggiatoa sp.]